MKRKDHQLKLLSSIGLFGSLLAASGCSDALEIHESVQTKSQALVHEDGLAEQYGQFRAEFTVLGRDLSFDIGLAALPPFGTEDIGSISLIFDFEQVNGTYTGGFNVRRGPEWSIPSDVALDVYAVRNVPGAGRSARPESGDAFTQLGSLTFNGESFLAFPANFLSMGVVDMLVVTRAGVSPAVQTVAIGNLSFFEKRFFAEAFGWTIDAPPGNPSAAVPTNDPWIEHGSDVFFNETFDGNGRTCGTCHRAENNFTIDEAFISSLPASDPLFQAALAVPGLEGFDPEAPLAQIQDKGLILENLDGFSENPVFRSVQHLLGVSASTTRQRVPILQGQVVSAPPDERTGWSGDGSPGRGTLHDFAVGAIVQHLTQDAERRAGVDFRLPTQLELDALEAFQLSLGRRKEIQIRPLGFRDTAAETGKNLFNGQGLCFICHDNAGARSGGPAIFNNSNLDQGVERRPETLALGLNPDAGMGREERFDEQGNFLGFGDGEFNVQSLIEAADTAPYFHNNSAATLEDAVRHYTTPAFESEPAGLVSGLVPQLSEAQVRDVAAFLRVINAAQNIAQVRQTMAFVAAQTSGDHRQLILLALEEVKDAIAVLDQPGRALATNARHSLATLKLIVEMTAAQSPAGQAAYAQVSLTWCGVFFDALFSANPNQEFTAD